MENFVDHCQHSQFYVCSDCLIKESLKNHNNNKDTTESDYRIQIEPDDTVKGSPSSSISIKFPPSEKSEKIIYDCLKKSDKFEKIESNKNFIHIHTATFRIKMERLVGKVLQNTFL